MKPNHYTTQNYQIAAVYNYWAKRRRHIGEQINQAIDDVNGIGGYLDPHLTYIFESLRHIISTCDTISPPIYRRLDSGRKPTLIDYQSKDAQNCIKNSH